MDAEKAKLLVQKRLSECKLDLDSDIICSMSDGASVMKKLGREIAPLHITCLAHAIHLCLCDVFYKLSGKSAADDYENYDECSSDDEDEEDHQYDHSSGSFSRQLQVDR